VYDRSSSNGTFLNGRRIEVATARGGDVLGLGPDARFRLSTVPPGTE
jgi:pSer/pThr/pTyr-binding forkhead associated (FHA) protein